MVELRLEATDGTIDGDIGATRLLLVPLLAANESDGEKDDAMTKGRVVVEIIIAEKKKIGIRSPCVRHATKRVNRGVYQVYCEYSSLLFSKCLKVRVFEEMAVFIGAGVREGCRVVLRLRVEVGETVGAGLE